MATFVKTRDIPIAGAHTLPQEFFTSAELFAQELDRIFARRWLCIGRES
jgi:phenylpropionate dioxygenase-like ring-hydroxylating dioxygenase large terminal subunit